MTDKWDPLVETLDHLLRDRDLMLAWGLGEYGDVQAEEAHMWIVHWKREDLRRLREAVLRRRESVQ